jgi:hypothetical protein
MQFGGDRNRQCQREELNLQLLFRELFRYATLADTAGGALILLGLRWIIFGRTTTLWSRTLRRGSEEIP